MCRQFEAAIQNSLSKKRKKKTEEKWNAKGAHWENWMKWKMVEEKKENGTSKLSEKLYEGGERNKKKYT